MIVIVAPADDIHAIIANRILIDRFGVSSMIVDLNAFPASASLALGIDQGRHRATFTHGHQRLDWADVTCVWWRRPQLFVGRALPSSAEDQDVYAFTRRESASLITTFFSPLVSRVVNRPQQQDAATCKGTQLLTAQRVALPIPATIITNSAAAIAAFRTDHPACIMKILTRYDRSLIPTSELVAGDLDDHGAIQASPVIVQERLPAGHDLRVNIFGADVHAASKPVRSVDGRDDRALWVEHDLPPEVGAKLRRLLDELGLDYGCVDLRLTPDGEYHFLEVNPSGQFLMVERDTGQELTESLCRLLVRGETAASGGEVPTTDTESVPS